MCLRAALTSRDLVSAEAMRNYFDVSIFRSMVKAFLLSKELMFFVPLFFPLSSAHSS